MKYHKGYIPLAGVLGAFVGSGVIAVYVFSIFAKQIALDFEWTRSTVALGLTVYSIANGLGGVFLGVAMDKWGMKKSTLIMVMIFGLSLASVSLLPPNFTLYLIIFSIMGFSGAAATILPYSLAISAWFDRGRGIMLGLVNVGTGLGGVFLPIIAAYLLTHYGWRYGYIGIGILAIIIPLFALLVLVRLPDDYEKQRIENREKIKQQKISTFSLVKENRHLKLFMVGIFCVAFATYGLLSQLTMIVTDKGISLMQAAGIMSAASIASTLSRLGTGFLLDFFPARIIAASLFGLSIIGIWLITANSGYEFLVIGAILLGFGLGSEGDIMTYMTSRYFPLVSYGTIVGLVWLTFAWGGASGMYLLNLSFDLLGQYAPAAYGFMVIVAIGIISILLMGDYIYPPEKNVKH